MKTASSRAERREGASQSRARLSDRYQGWLRHHRLSAADSLHRVLEKPVASVLTFLVMGIALALPVGLSVALDNADRLNANWQGPAEISLFLSPQLTEARAVELAESIAGREDVARAHFVSRDQAMEEFRKLSGFADVLDSLEENPLPHLILVTPLEESRASVLSRALQDQPEVAEAVLDRAWLQRLQAIMELSSRLVLAVGALLVFGVVLILGNTIRLAIENRRDEIVIVKLVGGSNAFVRRPFLYTGLWYGVGGGVFAALLVALSLWYLQVPVNELAVLYGSDFRLRGAGVMGGLNLVVLGAFLGLAGAWLAVARHLSVIEPR
jgi:cell division transport system permease protein